MSTFITLYGINNIGKTYHAKLLTKRLNKLGKKAVYIKYPIYTQKPSGPFLNKILRSGKAQTMPEEELQLWFVLNRFQFQPRLKKLLNSGMIVVAEDYVGTGIAWGSAKAKNSKIMMKELERMNTFLVRENVPILLDGERSLHAREKQHIHEQNDALVEKCKKIFKQLGKKYKWSVVKVAEKKEDTADLIWKIVSKHLT